MRVVDFEALEDSSDDRLLGIWVQNPYFQAFCGERTFQWPEPCASSDLTHFRKRLGEEGVEKIFKAPVLPHGPQALEKEVLIDATGQEKNIFLRSDYV